MGDLEREEIFLQISDTLDNVDEILDDSDVDAETDEQIAELIDLISQIRTLIMKKN